jgi:hypothetical protein
MTARKILLAMSILMLASICWGQYSTTVTQGATNITGNLPTVNAWHALGGQCGLGMAEGGDGYILCMNTAHNIYSYDLKTRTYISMDAMGTSMIQLAIGDGGRIYALSTAGTCKTIYKWSGTAWVVVPGCMAQIAVSPNDTSLVGTNAGNTWISVKGDGTDWVQISGGGLGQVLSYVSASSSASMCGIGSVHIGKGWGNGIYTSSGGTFTQLATQPSNQPIGCVMTHNALIAWNATWLAIYDLTAQTWTNVSGLSTISGVSAFSLGTILAIGPGGQPYHLNAIAPYTSAQLSGAFTGCPSDTQPCPPSGVTHEKQIRVQYPSGLGGALGDYSGAPTDPTPVSSLAFTGNCDLLFGNPNDPGCHPTVSGAVLCSVVGSSIYTPGYIPCYIGIWRPAPVDNLSIPKPWPTGATIHVYFDGTFWPGGGCPTPSYCKFFTGVSSWTGAVPSANLHYQNMGVITGGCGGLWPCGMQYPFIYVTGAHGGSSENFGMQSTPGTGHQWDIVAVLTDVIAANNTHELQMTGAHEEGHNQMLDDCHPGAPSGTPGWQCTASDQSKTVMWWVGDPSNPVSPMPCDMDWATIYRYIF